MFKQYFLNRIPFSAQQKLIIRPLNKWASAYTWSHSCNSSNFRPRCFLLEEISPKRQLWFARSCHPVQSASTEFIRINYWCCISMPPAIGQQYIFFVSLFLLLCVTLCNIPLTLNLTVMKGKNSDMLVKVCSSTKLIMSLVKGVQKKRKTFLGFKKDILGGGGQRDISGVQKDIWGSWRGGGQKDISGVHDKVGVKCLF